MKIEDFTGEGLYLPKLEAWEHFCLTECQGRNVTRIPQPVIKVLDVPYDGYVQLAFPLHLWRIEDLELCKSNKSENRFTPKELKYLERLVAKEAWRDAEDLRLSKANCCPTMIRNHKVTQESVNSKTDLAHRLNQYAKELEKSFRF